MISAISRYFPPEVVTGATTTTVANEKYSVSPLSGRVTLSGKGLTHAPAFYLATPASNTESIAAFGTGLDSTGTGAIFTALEPGVPGNVTLTNPSGSYFFGNEPDGSLGNSAGVLNIGVAGKLTGTQFKSEDAPAFLSQTPVTGTLTIDNAKGVGTGNIGPNTFAITNGIKLFFIRENTAALATMTVAEHQ